MKGTTCGGGPAFGHAVARERPHLPAPIGGGGRGEHFDRDVRCMPRHGVGARLDDQIGALDQGVPSVYITAPRPEHGQVPRLEVKVETAFRDDAGVDEWAKVERALASTKWDFRSVEGIATEIGMPPQRVRALLMQNTDKVRTTLSRDKRVVYALRSKPVTAREVLDSLVTFASH